ncbi:hypothetical protein B0H13DRAFT_1891524 [Mycena leptocephala]|nr:hypothetical protein B0H13DRAFT_1891524 [Mycena leptocephala]
MSSVQIPLNQLTRALEEHNRLSLSYTYAPNQSIRTAFEWVKHKTGKILRERRQMVTVDHTTPIEQTAFVTMVGVVCEHNAQLTTVANYRPEFNNTAAKAKFVIQLDCPSHIPFLVAAWDNGVSNLRHIEHMVCDGSANFWVEDKETGLVSIRLSKPLFEPKGKPQEVDPTQWQIPVECRDGFTRALQGNDLRPMRAFDTSDKPIAPHMMQQALPGSLVAATWKMVFYNIRKEDSSIVPSMTGEIIQAIMLEPPRPKPQNVFSSARPYRPSAASPAAFPPSPQQQPPSAATAPLPQVPYQTVTGTPTAVPAHVPNWLTPGGSTVLGTQAPVSTHSHPPYPGSNAMPTTLHGDMSMSPFVQIQDTHSRNATPTHTPLANHIALTAPGAFVQMPQAQMSLSPYVQAPLTQSRDATPTHSPLQNHAANGANQRQTISPTWNTPPSVLTPPNRSQDEGVSPSGLLKAVVSATADGGRPNAPTSFNAAPSVTFPGVLRVSSHSNHATLPRMPPPTNPSPFYTATSAPTASSVGTPPPSTPPNTAHLTMPDTPGRERTPSYATPVRHSADRAVLREADWTVAAPQPVVGADGPPISARSSGTGDYGDRWASAAAPSGDQRPMTRMLTPTLVQRVPTPRPSSAQAHSVPPAVANELLPTFDISGTSSASDPGFGSWANELMSLNDTRAPTPHDSAFGMVASAFSPPSSTPTWMGIYGDVAQSFMVGADDGAVTDEGVFTNAILPGRPENASSGSDSSASSSTGDSVSWDTTGSSDDSEEPAMDKYKRLAAIRQGKRKAVIEDDQDVVPHKRRLHRVNWSVNQDEEEGAEWDDGD